MQPGQLVPLGLQLFEVGALIVGRLAFGPMTFIRSLHRDFPSPVCIGLDTLSRHLDLGSLSHFSQIVPIGEPDQIPNQPHKEGRPWGSRRTDRHAGAKALRRSARVGFVSPATGRWPCRRTGPSRELGRRSSARPSSPYAWERRIERTSRRGRHEPWTDRAPEHSGKRLDDSLGRQLFDVAPIASPLADKRIRKPQSCTQPMMASSRS